MSTTKQKKECTFEGCERPRVTKTLCQSHRNQEKAGKELKPLRAYYGGSGCIAEGCKAGRVSKGYCTAHYNNLVLGLQPKGTLRFCDLNGCESKHYAKGFCRKHYSQQRELPDNPCIEEGCEKPQVARGYCDTDYQRRKNQGQFTDLRPRAKNNMTDEEFREFIKKNTYKDAVSDCWIWNGKHRNADEEDYHQLSYNGYPEWQHRVAYAVFNGPLEPGLVIDHICHQKHCCNPEHLRQVTQAENMANQKVKIGQERIFHLEDSNEWSAFVLYIEDWVYLGKFATKELAKQAQIQHIKNKAA